MPTTKTVNRSEKGKRIERECVAFLRRCGFEARRGQQHRGGPDSPDVICPSLPHIECKGDDKIDLNTARWESAIQQARDESPTDEFIVLWRPSRKDWRLTWVDGIWGVPVTVAGEERVRQVLIKMSEER